MEGFTGLQGASVIKVLFQKLTVPVDVGGRYLLALRILNDVQKRKRKSLTNHGKRNLLICS